MSKSQAIRGQFLFFAGSSDGGTQPTIAIYKTLDGSDCSSIVACAALVRKTIEIRGTVAGLGTNPVIVEGTVSETANDKTFWFPLSGVINAPGLFTIDTSGAGPQLVFYEPELTFLRIRARQGEVAPGSFHSSIGATMAAVYNGDMWEERVKASALGRPARNTDYQAV